MSVPWVVTLALRATSEHEDGFKACQDAMTLVSNFSLDILQRRWREMLFLGLVVTAFGSWAQTMAQRIVPAPFAAVIYSLDPFLGCLIAWIWLGEQLSFQGRIGAALLLVAVFGQLTYRAVQKETSD